MWALGLKTERRELKPVPRQGHILRKRRDRKRQGLGYSLSLSLRPSLISKGEGRGPAWPKGAHWSLGTIPGHPFIPLPWAAAGPLPRVPPSPICTHSGSYGPAWGEALDGTTEETGGVNITQKRKLSRTFRKQGRPRQAGGLNRLPSNLYTGNRGPEKARACPGPQSKPRQEPGSQGPRQSPPLTLHLQFS